MSPTARYLFLPCITVTDSTVMDITVSDSTMMDITVADSTVTDSTYSSNINIQIEYCKEISLIFHLMLLTKLNLSKKLNSSLVFFQS